MLPSIALWEPGGQRHWRGAKTVWIALALLIKVVRFLMGCGFSPGLINPVRHWSKLTQWTFGICRISSTNCRPHEEARWGCSNAKYPPFKACCLQMLIVNLSKASASWNLLCFSSSVILCKLNKACNGEYIVQGGDATANFGFLLLMMLRHSALLSIDIKS